MFFFSMEQYFLIFVPQYSLELTTSASAWLVFHGLHCRGMLLCLALFLTYNITLNILLTQKHSHSTQYVQ